MKNRAARLSFILKVVVLGLSLFFVYQFRDDLWSIRLLEPWAIAPASLCILGTMFLNGLFNKVFFRYFEAELVWREWLGLSFVSSLGNLIAPLRGGTVSNAVYLKQRFGLSYSDFVSSLAAAYVWTFLVNSGLAICALLIVGNSDNEFYYPMLAVFALVFVAFAIVAVFAPQLPRSRIMVIDFFLRALNAWRFIQQQRSLMLAIGAITLGNALLQTGVYFYLFKALATEVSLGASLMLAVVTAFSSLINITPANLGVRESFTGFTAWAVAVPVPQTIVISILERLILFLLTFVLGFYFGGELLKLAKRHEVPTS